MKRTNIFYWTFTILFALMMTASAIPDIIMEPSAVQVMHNELGYPKYFIPFIGVVKVLGVLAILIPVGARLREWAYAGLIFDLIGAAFSIMAIGQNSYYMLALPLSIGFLSYYFYHKRRRLSKIRQGEIDPGSYQFS